MVCFLQKHLHFLISCLRKVLVPATDTIKRFSGHPTNHLIHFKLECVTRFWGSYRYSNDDPRGVLSADTRHGSPHARAGGKTIIDQDDSPIADLWRRAV